VRSDERTLRAGYLVLLAAAAGAGGVAARPGSDLAGGAWVDVVEVAADEVEVDLVGGVDHVAQQVLGQVELLGGEAGDDGQQVPQEAGRLEGLEAVDGAQLEAGGDGDVISHVFGPLEDAGGERLEDALTQGGEEALGGALGGLAQRLHDALEEGGHAHLEPLAHGGLALGCLVLIVVGDVEGVFRDEGVGGFGRVQDLLGLVEQAGGGFGVVGVAGPHGQQATHGQQGSVLGDHALVEHVTGHREERATEHGGRVPAAQDEAHDARSRQGPGEEGAGRDRGRQSTEDVLKLGHVGREQGGNVGRCPEGAPIQAEGVGLGRGVALLGVGLPAVAKALDLLPRGGVDPQEIAAQQGAQGQEAAELFAADAIGLVEEVLEPGQGAAAGDLAVKGLTKGAQVVELALHLHEGHRVQIAGGHARTQAGDELATAGEHDVGRLFAAAQGQGHALDAVGQVEALQEERNRLGIAVEPQGPIGLAQVEALDALEEVDVVAHTASRRLGCRHGSQRRGRCKCVRASQHLGGAEAQKPATCRSKPCTSCRCRRGRGCCGPAWASRRGGYAA
jgi:hypothetical protein